MPATIKFLTIQAASGSELTTDKKKHSRKRWAGGRRSMSQRHATAVGSKVTPTYRSAIAIPRQTAALTSKLHRGALICIERRTKVARAKAIKGDSVAAVEYTTSSSPESITARGATTSARTLRSLIT